MTTRIAMLPTYRVERWIVTEIDATSPEDAIEMLAEGAIDIPAFDDPDWTDVHNLEHEDYRPA